LTAGTPTVAVTANVTITPSGANLTLTAGTPTVAVSTNTVITPSGANLTLTAGTPTVVIPQPPITPDGVTLSLHPGTPTVTLGALYDSFRVAALSIADYVQPVHTGTGARISRNSGTGINPVLTTAGTPALLPANTFDTIDVCTSDIIVDLSTNKMTFLTAGYYLVKICLYSSGSIRETVSSFPSAVSIVLAKNGSLYQEDQTYMTASNTTTNSIRSVTGTFLLDVDTSDYIQPGNDVYFNDLSAFSIVGPSPYTYMGVSLLNKKA
jgi:hypothetical protein